MKQGLSTVAVALLLAATGVACDKLNPPQPELQKPPATTEPASAQEKERKDFAQAAQKELDELQASMSELRARMASANREIQARLGKEMEELEVELRDAQQRLAELRSATADTWARLKQTFSQSLEKLKGSIDHFRKNTA